MSNIKVQCVDHASTFTNSPVISSGNTNYDTITFDFCPNWDGFIKTAIFYKNPDEVYYQLLDSADTCEIPNEVLDTEGVFYVGVFGTLDDQTITSEILAYKVRKGAVTDDLLPSYPTPEIYEQITSRYNDYDTRLAYFEERFNGSVGDAELFGGQLPEYYATAQSVSDIQITSRATLSTAGWYRIAEFTCANENIAKGNQGDGCELYIRQNYQNLGEITAHLGFIPLYNNPRFTLYEIRTLSAQSIVKIRHTYDLTEGKAWLEVYYNFAKANDFVFTITACMSAHRTLYWRAITPTATEETVDGVTVTTTYDIPANASPVTDLDLAQVDGTTVLTTSILDKALSHTANGAYTYKLGGAYAGTDLPQDYYKYGYALVYVSNVSSTRAGTTVMLTGFPYRASDGSAEAKRIAINYYTTAGAWSGWQIFTTTSDLTTALAGYLPLDGSKAMTGSLYVGTSSDTSAILSMVRNSLRSIYQSIATDGTYALYDATNSKYLIKSTADGTTTFNGTAIGNLPTTGGTVNGGVTVSSSSAGALAVNNTNGDGLTLIRFRDNGTQMGMLGFNGTDNPVYRNNSGTVEYKLLHSGNYTDYALPKTGGTLTGALSGTSATFSGNLTVSGTINGGTAITTANSAKVVVSETPLTAEGSVRVW